jgi:hypothetical protein
LDDTNSFRDNSREYPVFPPGGKTHDTEKKKYDKKRQGIFIVLMFSPNIYPHSGG